MLTTLMVLAVACGLIYIWIGGRDAVPDNLAEDPAALLSSVAEVSGRADRREPPTIVDDAIAAIDQTFKSTQPSPADSVDQPRMAARDETAPPFQPDRPSP